MPIPVSFLKVKKFSYLAKHLALLTILFIALFVTACDQNEQSTTSVTELKRIGVATFVDHVVLNTIRDGFLEKLRTDGYTKENGWNIVVLNANGDQTQAAAVADDLLNLRPNILVSFSTPATKPLFEKNNGRIPMVFSFVSFPESIGISEKAPNVTGLSDGVDFELLLALVRDVMPDIKQIGMIFSDEPNARVSYNRVKAIADSSGFQLYSQSVSKEEEVRGAVEVLLQQPEDRRPQAIIVGADGVVTNKIGALLDVTDSAKVPVFAVDESSVEKGALAGLSVNYVEFGKETAEVVERVLQGEKPDSIPMSQYLAKDILINKITAEKIGITVPSPVIEKAIKVIQ